MITSVIYAHLPTHAPETKAYVAAHATQVDPSMHTSQFGEQAVNLKMISKLLRWNDQWAVFKNL